MGFERYDRITDYYPTMWPLIVPGYAPVLNAMLEVVRARDVRPREVLDLGCGPGMATIAVAPGCDPDTRVTLVDGAPKMLQAAQGLLAGRVRLAVCEDFLRPGILDEVAPSQSHDLALCSFALHHWDDAQKHGVIAAIARALKPGGLALIADEVACDQPGGWDVVGRIRARIVQDHLAAGRIPREFFELEASLPMEQRLPFKPSRQEDFVSWMAHAGLAVSWPVTIFGASLLVGVKPS